MITSRMLTIITLNEIYMRGVLSMKLDLELRPGANRFVSETGALAYLDTILKDFTKPVVITGEKSFAAFTKAYPGKLN